MTQLLPPSVAPAIREPPAPPSLKSPPASCSVAECWIVSSFTLHSCLVVSTDPVTGLQSRIATERSLSSLLPLSRMRRSDSRSGLARSSSTRSIGSNAEVNASRSAAVRPLFPVPLDLVHVLIVF